MRRILTKELQEKKTKRNQLILGLILITLMLFSVLGYALWGRGESQNINKIEYNNIEFIQDNSDYWAFQIQGQDFLTKYNAEEVQEIYAFINFNINNYANKPLYLVSDSEDANSEIVRNLGNRFVPRIQKACLSQESCLEDIPIKNCSIDNIIVIEISEEKEQIYQEENCVFISAKEENQVKYADAYLFNILGV